MTGKEFGEVPGKKFGDEPIINDKATITITIEHDYYHSLVNLKESLIMRSRSFYLGREVLAPLVEGLGSKEGWEH